MWLNLPLASSRPWSPPPLPPGRCQGLWVKVEKKSKAIGDKLGVVDNQDVKEDTDGHNGCGRVHQVGAQPRWKISDSANWFSSSGLKLMSGQKLTCRCRRASSLSSLHIPPVKNKMYQSVGQQQQQHTHIPPEQKIESKCSPARAGKCCQWWPRRWWGLAAWQRATWRRSGSRRRETCLWLQRIAEQQEHCQPWKERIWEWLVSGAYKRWDDLPVEARMETTAMVMKK